MFWKKRNQKSEEFLPWYRVPEYDGNLTEDEKRELDSFRLREKQGQKHPAASYDELAAEVQMYISKLEIERYDLIQQTLVGRCFLISVVGAFLLANHFGWLSVEYDMTEVLLIGAVLLVAPWVYYPIKWRKNADRFWQGGPEGIRTQWELEYIVNRHVQSRPK